MKDFHEWLIGAVLAVLLIAITYSALGGLLRQLIETSFASVK